MNNPKSKVTKIKLKRCEKSQNSDAKALSKISCKIGDHFVNAFINSGSSISIASTDLYRKLVADKCAFKDGKATLNLIDDSIPDQEYRITTATVQVIGKSKSINLVTFPNVFAPSTILGMDFLTTKSDPKSNENVVFRVPDKPAPKSKAVHSEEKNDEDKPVSLLDWILDTRKLKKPLYNILADGTADDDDLFAICAFMKRMPRMVSPIRRLEKQSCVAKQVDVKLVEASTGKTDNTPIAPDNSSSTNQTTTSKTLTPSVSSTSLEQAKEKAKKSVKSLNIIKLH